VTTTLHITGVKEAMHAFSELPKRIGIKHVRIALNAGCGVVRNRYAAMAHRESGLLSKSIGIKVKIPDASHNAKHHGKPAYGVIGPKRNAGKIMRRNSKGNLKGYGAAQRELKFERARLAAAGTLSPLQREREARRFTQASFTDGQYRNPSRYAHLAGKNRQGAEVLNSAMRQSQGAAAARIAEKLQQGIEAEASVLVKQ
jgi:hypothetical protein